MRALFLVLLLGLVFRPIFADSVLLNGGRKIENVIVQGMTGLAVTYRTRNGQIRSVPYNQVSDIVYAPLEVPERERRATRLPRLQAADEEPRRAGAAPAPENPLNRIEKKWNELEVRAGVARARLHQVIASIGSSSGDIETFDDSGKAVARSVLNVLLDDKKKYESELEEVRKDQKALRREFLELARRMGIQMTFAEEASGRSGSVSPFSALWRSALIPGWGQLYRERYLRAGVLGIGSLGLGGALAVNQDNYRSAVGRRELWLRTALLAVTLESKGLRDFAVLQGLQAGEDVSRLARLNNAGTGAMLVLYAINLIDASFSDFQVGLSDDGAGPNFMFAYHVRY